MKFSIRDILLVTVIVALALGWWLDRSRLAIRAQEADQEAESSQALSEALTQQLQDKNPAASIEINVHGRGSSSSTGYGTPNPQAPTRNLPVSRRENPKPVTANP